jgi:hypothetical protein
MRPFATGNTFAPFAFRGVEASLLDAVPAGFAFPMFRVRKASVGYQSGIAEFWEPVKVSTPDKLCDKRHKCRVKDRITMTILPHPSLQLAPKF